MQKYNKIQYLTPFLKIVYKGSQKNWNDLRKNAKTLKYKLKKVKKG